VIAGKRIARQGAARPPAVHPSAPPGNATAAVPKVASIIAITSGRTAPA
jgi:hypothetical protein